MSDRFLRYYAYPFGSEMCMPREQIDTLCQVDREPGAHVPDWVQDDQLEVWSLDGCFCGYARPEDVAHLLPHPPMMEEEISIEDLAGPERTAVEAMLDAGLVCLESRGPRRWKLVSAKNLPGKAASKPRRARRT